jgi:GNAT superfamily N-acetyltransferase
MIFADLALARRLEAAEVRNGLECTEAQARAHPEIGSLALPVCGGYAIYVGRASPLTHAVGMGLERPVRESELEQMEAFFRSRGACVTVDLCPLAEPSLVGFLSLRGYRLAEFNNVLVKPLPPAAPDAADPRVRRSAPAEADLWAATAGSGFFEGKDLTAEELDVGLNIFHMASAECYLACPETGGTVAAAAMAIHDGLATLFADSTLPAARRQGWHSALIRSRLRAAAARGCDLAMAATLPGSTSQRNYERCGFQVAYTRVVLAG